MSLQQVIMFACVGLGLTAAVSFVLLVVLYAAEERRRKRQLARTEADKSEITILFQTMRDVVSQQKDLAKQFNHDLDAKMGVVKQILAQSLDKNKKLYEQQRALSAELESAKTEMREMQAELARLRGDAPQTAQARPTPNEKAPHAPPRQESLGFIVPDAPETAPTPTPDEAPTQPKPPAGDVREPEALDTFIIGRPRRGEKRPPADEIRMPNEEALAGTGLTRAQYQKWIGDALDQANVAEEEEVAPPAPIAPEDAAKARDAFRALLDLERQNAQRGAADIPGDNGNGAHGGASLQKRILEYYDAGMTVSQIARELGIGKGEVRLMLSLAQQERE